ncbi:putative phage abortive infection protein [Paenibacillus sp. FSL K6-1230]|uniref:putative phage abortive infection protein n=1 Tax=Paenibacillus sp. FSL K6-1230 TaxID=2921603 RepID=UPI0030FB4B9E
MKPDELQDKKTKDAKDTILHKYLLFGSIFMVILGVLSPSVIASIFNRTGFEGYMTLGTIGDWLGGSTTPFLTFATFLIVVAGYLAQREELKSTKEELVLNREEMEKSRSELKNQTENLTKQGFENTFFKMISLHNEIIASMIGHKSSSGVRQKTGRESFAVYYEELKRKYNHGVINGLERSNALKSSYRSLYSQRESDLFHYYNHLYTILELIDSSSLKKEDKLMYARIFKSQLSSHEIIIILYHGLSEMGYELSVLLRKYRIFENINRHLLFAREDLADFYDIESRNRNIEL